MSEGGSFSAHAALEETGELVAVGFPRHVVDRFRERVRPAVSNGRARLDLQGYASAYPVTGQKPSWADHVHATMWLCPSPDVAFVLTPDRHDPAQLIATTCLTRDRGRS